MFANYYAALLLNNVYLPYAAKDLQKVEFQVLVVLLSAQHIIRCQI